MGELVNVGISELGNSLMREWGNGGLKNGGSLTLPKIIDYGLSDQ